MEKRGREGRNKGGTSVCQCLLPSILPPSYAQPPGREDGELGGQAGPRLAAFSVLPLGPVALKQGKVRAPWGWTQAEGRTGLQSVLPPPRTEGPSGLKRAGRSAVPKEHRRSGLAQIRRWVGWLGPEGTRGEVLA